MEILNHIVSFFSDMTNAGMVVETIGISLVAIYGIPRNNDVGPDDTVIIKREGEDLNRAMRLLKTFIRRERLGFILMGLGFLLMLIDRNI